MEIVIVSIVALVASLLTFFSGFGLGTILTPVLVIFFPVDVGIALTGREHLLNNFFKISLVGKQINWQVGIKFGLMAVIGAFIGAQLLLQLTNTTVLYSYTLHSKTFSITPIKLIISLLMIIFALFDTAPVLKNIQFSQ